MKKWPLFSSAHSEGIQSSFDDWAHFGPRLGDAEQPQLGEIQPKYTLHTQKYPTFSRKIGQIIKSI